MTKSASVTQVEFGDNDRITLKQARMLFPLRPHIATMRRWYNLGLKDKVGDRIKLRIYMEGGQIVTTAKDVRRFTEALNK